MALRGKVALITGCSSGIGAGIAAVFAREGAKLSLTGRNEKNLEEIAKNCKMEASGDALTNVGDITQDAFRKTLVEATRMKFGKIDVLVNNAGIALLSPLQSSTKELYDSTMAVNLEAPVFLTQLAAPYLIESKVNLLGNEYSRSYTEGIEDQLPILLSLGRVVIPRESGFVTDVFEPFAGEQVPTAGIYAMSKAAVDTFTRYLAHEMASHGVRVNAVNPGYVPTQILTRQLPKDDVDQMESALTKSTLVGRLGTAEEIGHIVAFLASEKAAFVTGECFRADGGLTLTTTVQT